jgi:hypothetical protein
VNWWGEGWEVKIKYKNHHSSFEVPLSVFVFNFFSGKVETKSPIHRFCPVRASPGVLSSKLPGHMWGMSQLKDLPCVLGKIWWHFSVITVPRANTPDLYVPFDTFLKSERNLRPLLSELVSRLPLRSIIRFSPRGRRGGLQQRTDGPLGLPPVQ